MNYVSVIKRDPEARLELAEAYTRLFTGYGSLQDAQIVFTDIMAFSGYFNVCPQDVNVHWHEGKRAVGGRLFSMANLPDAERDALYRAARQSSMIDQTEGEI